MASHFNLITRGRHVESSRLIDINTVWSVHQDDCFDSTHHGMQLPGKQPDDGSDGAYVALSDVERLATPPNMNLWYMTWLPVECRAGHAIKRARLNYILLTKLARLHAKLKPRLFFDHVRCLGLQEVQGEQAGQRGAEANNCIQPYGGLGCGIECPNGCLAEQTTQALGLWFLSASVHF